MFFRPGAKVVLLGINKNIQAESFFARVKQDMPFRRFLYRGQKNVLIESILPAMNDNINKIQANQTEKHLFELNKCQ